MVVCLTHRGNKFCASYIFLSSNCPPSVTGQVAVLGGGYLGYHAAALHIHDSLGESQIRNPDE